MDSAESLQTVPANIDTSETVSENHRNPQPELPKGSKLLRELIASFETEPIEDGFDHPSELIVNTALNSSESQSALSHLRDFTLDEEHPYVSYSILRCLGRISKPGSTSWRTNLIRDALLKSDPQIRDAAIQAGEHWGGVEIKGVLSLHVEPIPWLQQYIEKVLRDLAD